MRRSRGWVIGALAAAGVVVTHLLTFLAAAPSAHERAHLLESTGHMGSTAVAAAALGLAVAVAVRLVPMQRPALHLVVLQSVGWLALESVERLTHPGSTWELQLVALGLLVQALLAALGALLVVTVRRAWAAVTARRPRRRATSVAVVHAVVRGAPRPLVLAGAAGVRGPPAGS